MRDDEVVPIASVTRISYRERTAYVVLDEWRTFGYPDDGHARNLRNRVDLNGEGVDVEDHAQAANEVQNLDRVSTFLYVYETRVLTMGHLNLRRPKRME